MGSGIAKCILYCIIFYRDCKSTELEKIEKTPSLSHSSDPYSDNTSIVVDRENPAILDTSRTQQWLDKAPRNMTF